MTEIYGPDRQVLEQALEEARTREVFLKTKLNKAKRASADALDREALERNDKNDAAEKYQNIAIGNRNLQVKLLNNDLTILNGSTCGLGFSSYAERFGDNDMVRLRLRCSDCSCRHDLGAGLRERFGMESL